jgi:hypothetical protein
MRKALCAFVVLAAASLAMASNASAASTTCNGTFTGATFGDIVVPDDGACTLAASTVNGNVTVKKKAYFEASATNISGSVTAFFSQTIYVHDASTVGRGINGFLTRQVLAFDSVVTSGSVRAIGTPFSDGQVNVCGVNVQNGNIDVLFSGSDILVGDPLTVDCAGNIVTGDVNVSANLANVELVVRGNTISHNLDVSFNKGPAGKFVEANTGGNRLACKGNQSPFTASANPGWTTKTGQCAGP